MALIGVVVAGGAIALLLRDRPSTPGPSPTAVAAPEPDRGIRNVILVSMDTTRWDAISAYGAPEVNSPRVGALAREGVVFENVFAPAPVTLPSHASMLTGTVPLANGVLDNARYRLGDEHQTLAEVLRANGFNTAAFVSALVLEARFGLDQGFEVYDDEIPTAALIGERRGDLTTARAVDWLERHAGERNFLFLHLFDPHAPYEAPEPFGSRMREVYREYPAFVQDYVAEIAFADHCIGLLLDALRRLGLYEQSLICVTADHGESHGEHGEITHGYFIYTSTMKVPLVLRVPETPGPLRVSETVGVVDIPTTILALLGLHFDGEVQGHDLTGYLDGNERLFPDRSILGLSVEPTKYGGSALLGLVVGDRQYIRAPRPELYDLSRDPYATSNLVDAEVETAGRLRGRLDGLLDRLHAAALPDEVSVDRDTRQRLEQLGYVVAGGVGEPLDTDLGGLDPKDLIGYHQAALDAMSYVVPENHARALAAAEEMIRMRPDFFFGYLMAARVLSASGRPAEAAAMLARAQALAPERHDVVL